MPGYISEYYHEGGGATDFIEVAVPTGTDTSLFTIVHYNSDGTVNATYALGSVVSTADGKDVYVLDSASALADIKSNEGIALVDDTGTVLQFLTSEGNDVVASEGPANGLTSRNVGGTSGGESHQTYDEGATYSAQAAPNKGTIPCYAPGTLIDTPQGKRAVETLRPGDLVMTVDHGPQPVRWMRSGDLALDGGRAEDKPVLIAAGALGAGRPDRDLIVSPQHRVLVGGAGQLTGYFDTPAFAPAKALTGLPGIRHMRGKAKITWIHFACDRHEVVTANGCKSESLLLGPMVLGGLTRAERRRVTVLFGGVAGPGAALNGAAARDCLPVGAARCQIADRLKRKRADEISMWDEDAALERSAALLLRCHRPPFGGPKKASV